jgi:hypothetical protein
LNGKFSAFPVPEAMCQSGDLAIARETGFTKREFLAAMAMQGLLSSERSDFAIKSEEHLAECAVKQADALLAELGKCLHG